MESNVLLLTGNDKMSYKLASKVQVIHPKINIVIDKTLGITKVIRLLFRKNNSITIFFLLNCFYDVFYRLRQSHIHFLVFL